MEVTLRTALPSDVPGIVALTNKCFDEDTSALEAQRIFDETIMDPNQVHIVALIDDNIVGLIRIAFIPTMFESMGTYAILNHVCVDPDHRRAHIGTKLMTEAERICREHGTDSIKLWSKNFRQPAHELYRHSGFESIDATFFEKELNNEN